MYVPRLNEMNSCDEQVDFIRQFPFATLITVENKLPQATHVPIVVTENGATISLHTHIAKANPQVEQLKNGVFLIFSAPHAYISPKNYTSPINVPTWNYIAVHVYGKARLIESSYDLEQLMEKTITAFESEFMSQWKTLPADYKSALFEEIVAFEILIDKIEGKKKLSQNKSIEEQQRIAENLSKSPHEHEQLVAKYMDEQVKK